MDLFLQDPTNSETTFLIEEVLKACSSANSGGGGFAFVSKSGTALLLANEGTTDHAKKHLLQMFPSAEVFDTPKPESLLERIFHIATNSGDLVLDPFLGSGTGAAVAQKMGRRFMGIEKAKTAAALCSQRLKNVVKGEGGGISAKYGWEGGGGFAFYKLTANPQ